jgi:hypothetical protein
VYRSDAANSLAYCSVPLMPELQPLVEDERERPEVEVMESILGRRIEVRYIHMLTVSQAVDLLCACSSANDLLAVSTVLSKDLYSDIWRFMLRLWLPVTRKLYTLSVFLQSRSDL